MIEIVKFKNGKYAIRKEVDRSYVYWDLNTDSDYWWAIDSKYISDCFTKSFNKIYKSFEKIAVDTNDFGVPADMDYEIKNNYKTWKNLWGFLNKFRFKG